MQDLLCRAAYQARSFVTAGMLEVPITIQLRKAARRVKRELGLTDLEIRGEHEIEDMSSLEPTLLGRIDVSFKFLEQFGDEDAYVAVECKRVGAGRSKLNKRYVTEGVARFVTGKYAFGHATAFMIGYVLALPVEDSIGSIDRCLKKLYGASARLRERPAHPMALAVRIGGVQRRNLQLIHIEHIFVDMTCAA